MSKPKANSFHEEIPDLPIDREESFSNSFEDPAMDEMLPDLTLDLSAGAEDAGLGIVQEAAAAVHELMLDASGTEGDLSTILPGNGGEFVVPERDSEPLYEIEAGLDMASEANAAFAIEESSETALLIARNEMADRMFTLVACERSFEDLIEGILISLQQALCAQAGSILEYDRKQNEFFFRSSIGGGDPEKVKAFRVPGMKGIVGHVAESRQALLLKNLETDEKQLQAISMSTGFETKSCLAAPIIIDNQLYGVVELFNKLTADHFDEKDLQVLEDGVRMATKVLEVRFLMAELVRRAG